VIQTCGRRFKVASPELGLAGVAGDRWTQAVAHYMPWSGSDFKSTAVRGNTFRLGPEIAARVPARGGKPKDGKREMIDNETFDATNRRLCPDGSCIGVLDAQGGCSDCGLRGQDPGEEPVKVSGPDSAKDSDKNSDRDASLAEQAQAPAKAAPAIVPAKAGAQRLEPFDPKRTLCPDGSCIGIVRKGRCTDCSVTLASAQSTAEPQRGNQMGAPERTDVPQDDERTDP